MPLSVFLLGPSRHGALVKRRKETTPVRRSAPNLLFEQPRGCHIPVYVLGLEP